MWRRISELEVVGHPSLSRDLTAIDHQLLTARKQTPDGPKFKDDRNMETVVTRWLIAQDRGWCQLGIGKFIPRCVKRPSFGGDYVEI
jgi:hypothetical protein